MYSGSRRGMTIVEMLIVIAIIVILAAIVMANVTAPALTAVAKPDTISTSAGSGVFAVRVTASGGHPQRGVTIRFETEGSGSVVPAEAVTDSTGVAKTTWRAGPDTGVFRITARASGRSRPELVVRTHVTGIPAAPAAAAAAISPAGAPQTSPAAGTPSTAPAGSTGAARHP